MIWDKERYNDEKDCNFTILDYCHLPAFGRLFLQTRMERSNLYRAKNLYQVQRNRGRCVGTYAGRVGSTEYAVFVGMDTDGVPRHAHKRSANSYGKAFRLNVEGSDPKRSFNYTGTDGSLYVFEAPIDLLVRPDMA